MTAGTVATRPRQGDRAVAGLSVADALLLTAAVTLPFTKGLTIPLAFPLKIYEIALGGLAMLLLAAGRMRCSRSVPALLLPLALFAIWAAGGVIARAIDPLPTLTSTGFSSRFGPVGDAVTKLVYLGLAVLAFVATSDLALRRPHLLARLWLLGAVVAAVYGWYLLAASIAGVPPILLPGITEPQRFTFGGLSVIRSGTFEEGNFFGLYLVLSTAIALQFRQLLTAGFLAVSVLTTFSTVNAIAVSLLIAYVAIRDATQGRGTRARAALLLGTLVALAAVAVASGFFTTIIADKLVGDDIGSRLDRLDGILSGLAMTQAHPVLGVGLSQFGYHYQAFAAIDLFASTHEGKMIANNVYVELASETGIVGLWLFTWFLWRVWRRIRASGSPPLVAAFGGMILAWNAYPTYSILFMWMFLGMAIGLTDANGPPEPHARPVPTAETA